MSLSNTQKRFLRAHAHALKPVVRLGDRGLTPGVLRELDLSIAHHELIKVHVQAADRPARTALIEAICQATGADLVQCIGHTAVLYRPAEPAKLVLPRA